MEITRYIFLLILFNSSSAFTHVQLYKRTNIFIQASSKRDVMVKSLRDTLSQSRISVMPCCYDGLSARLVERAGFNLTFMTGFGAAATYGLPDTGLTTATDMIRSAETICASLKSIPCIGDGDTGYGNPMNVKRTVRRYAAAGMAGIMIEDQVSPKRCGHTQGKQVVGREEAYSRIKAAVDARNEGEDIVILARTDARAVLGLDEAIERCRRFRELGADWTFLEAPQSEDEMLRYCREVGGPKLANMLEFGLTPVLSPRRLEEIGYTVAAYPLTLLSASARAMAESLELLKLGNPSLLHSKLLDFKELQDVVGFNEYDAELMRYKY